MRRLHYSGDSVLVSDRTCKAVLRYARALAEADSSDVVSVPVVQEGAVVLAHFLIGPASQIYSMPAVGGDDEPLEDEAIIRHLEEASRRMHPGMPAWPDEMPDIPDLDLL